MTDEAPMDWYDVREMGIEGKGWQDTESFFERLPAKARGLVREPVWERSRCPAGLCAHFETDATEIHARWTLEEEELGTASMPASGKSGLDLYATDAAGKWRWVACFAPGARDAEASIGGLAAGKRRYRLYLPLRNPLREARIGVPRVAGFAPVPARPEKPIVYYGTSIVHGASASRPGMCHAAILGRRLDRPMINLGFSGNGKMEPEVADLLAELDPCMYIVDCLPNMTADLVAERAAPLVRTLRATRPEAPIVLVEDRTYANSWIIPAKQERNASSRAAQRKAYGQLRAEGVKDLHYVEGNGLLGNDDEATVDSSHPTDLGFWRYTDDAFLIIYRGNDTGDVAAVSVIIIPCVRVGTSKPRYGDIIYPPMCVRC